MQQTDFWKHCENTRHWSISFLQVCIEKWGKCILLKVFRLGNGAKFPFQKSHQKGLNHIRSRSTWHFCNLTWVFTFCLLVSEVLKSKILQDICTWILSQIFVCILFVNMLRMVLPHTMVVQLTILRISRTKLGEMIPY